MKKVRTKHYMLTGAIGGFLGFLLMEIVRFVVPAGDGRGFGEILALAAQFSGFGLAVGAALGATEGFFQKKPSRLIYGLALGLILGATGGCAGGGVGQAIFNLLPHPEVEDSPGTDLAIVLDESGSMKELFFFGSDPSGLRIEAARKLIKMLGPADRVAVIAFNQTSRVLAPLTQLDSKKSRREISRALDRVRNSGGTNLDAGLSRSFQQLIPHRSEQSQNVIFLTDGAGEFHEETLAAAIANNVRVFTIGLGGGVQKDLLALIAERTGGRYYSVEDADELWSIFEAIYRDNIDMASHSQEEGGAHPLLLFIFRVLSWGVMGMMIGAGQGVRENTQEDLKACTFGGLAGGLIGGALFNPVSDVFGFGSGLLGRCVSEIIVGASIGGSMRMAQGLVLQEEQRTKSLSVILPEKKSSLVAESPPSPEAPGSLRTETSDRENQIVEKKGVKGLVLQVKEAVEGREEES